MNALAQAPNMTALLATVDALHDEFFTVYRGGWQDQIGVALVDAVHFIQVPYDSEHSERGVLNRVKRLKAKPDAADDLSVLDNLEEDAIQTVIGEGKTSQRTKSGAVQDAPRAMVALEPATVQAADVASERRETARRVYTRPWVGQNHVRLLRRESRLPWGESRLTTDLVRCSPRLRG